MKIKRLTKYYDKLSARERFSLLVAAGARGDETEQKHLMRSSPKNVFSVPTYRGYSEGFCDVSNLYLTGQLETGIWMWRVLAMLEGDQKSNPRLLKCLRLFAYQFSVQQQAWERLCEEYGIDGVEVLCTHPASATMKDLEELASTFASSPEKATSMLRQGDEEGEVITAEKIYEGMKEAIQERVAWWA